MIKLTKRVIRKKYKQTTSLFADITAVILGLIFEIGMPIATLILSIIVISFNPLMGILVLLVVFPLVLGIGLFLFRGVIISTIKNRLKMRACNYKIVRAKCINIKPWTIDTETGEATTFRYTFQADDGNIEATDMKIEQGHTAYLVVVGKEAVAAFDDKEYCTDKYTTSLFNQKHYSKHNKNISAKTTEKSKSISGYIFFEFLLFGVIVFDVIGFLTKEWIVACGGGLLMVFYFLFSLILSIHSKATCIITLIYLFINGIICYYLSYTYSHSTAAYIVGTVYILISLLISVIWINVKSKNN